jgi:cell shape-determining protein MreC
MKKWILYIITIGGLITFLLSLLENSQYRALVKRLLAQIKTVEAEVEKEKEVIGELDKERKEVEREEKARRESYKKEMKRLKDSRKNRVKKIREDNKKARDKMDSSLKNSDPAEADKITQETIDLIRNL